MKVLVNEIEKEALVRIKDYFVREDEITILEDASIEFQSLDCEQPFYIEENIDDLDSVIQLCADVDYNRAVIGKKLDFEDFSGFHALILSIYKQREFGRKICDLEYIYEKYKSQFDIKLVNAKTLDKWFSGDFDVICGESDLGEIYLYKMNDYFDFIVFVLHEKKGLFGKYKKSLTHWHPSNFFEASDDLAKFMSNSEQMYKFLNKNGQ